MPKKNRPRTRSFGSLFAKPEPPSRVARFKRSVVDFIEDESFDRRLDQSVDFLSAHGFGGAQLKHLFGLTTRRQKFFYIASVTGFTMAVTLFSQGLVGRTLKRVPFLRWG